MSILHGVLLWTMSSGAASGAVDSRWCDRIGEIQDALMEQAREAYRSRKMLRGRRMLREARELALSADECARTPAAGDADSGSGDAGKKQARVVRKSVWPCLAGADGCAPEGPEREFARTLQDAVVNAPRKKTVWDEDGRRAPAGAREEAVARATVALVDPDRMERRRGRWRVGPVQLLREQWRDLCSEERFQDEPLVSGCSGVLVAPQWVATARHCLIDVPDPRVVFGFGHPSPPVVEQERGRRFVEFPESEVFTIVEVRRSDSWEDWALLRLDRRAAVAPIALDLARVADDAPAELAIVGHPRGLPLKYAARAWVLSVGPAEDPGVFHASLDAYSGNSGSPIVRQDTGELVGLLSAGAADLVVDPTRGCRRSLVCQKDAYCTGEQVQRIDGSFAEEWRRIAGGPPTPMYGKAGEQRQSSGGKYK